MRSLRSERKWVESLAKRRAFAGPNEGRLHRLSRHPWFGPAAGIAKGITYHEGSNLLREGSGLWQDCAHSVGALCAFASEVVKPLGAADTLGIALVGLVGARLAIKFHKV